MLASLVRVEYPNSEPDPEEILGSSLSALYPDDIQNQHGDSTSRVVYESAYGELKLQCADPEPGEEHSKFAHHLWNAGILMGEFLGGKPVTPRACWPRDKDWWLSDGEQQIWSAKGQSVIELGAGVALSGILAALGGASEVVITDYPAASFLDNIAANVKQNVSDPIPSNIKIEPHLWGDLTSPLASARAHSFSRVVAADTLWMVAQHETLIKSIAHFLAYSSDARAFVVAGFHTGRARVANFFQHVPDSGLEIEQIFEMDSDGDRREWKPSRAKAEGAAENKRWVVVAVLKWPQSRS